MGRNKKQMHSYGYSETQESVIILSHTFCLLKEANIKLGYRSFLSLRSMVKCSRCNKWKNHANFSNKQLLDAKYAIKVNGRNATYRIKCRGCTGQQVMEIECMMCHETKGLEEYAKVQRAKPDCAKCMACVEKQLELDAVEDDKYEDPRDAYEPIDHSAGNYPEYWGHSNMTSIASDAGTHNFEGSDDGSDSGGGINLDGDMHKLSLSTSNTNTNTTSLIDIGYCAHGGNNGGPVQSGGDGWVMAGAKSWNSKSQTQLSTWSGFDPTAYGHPRSGADSVAGSANTFNSTNTEQTETNKKGFAKIKAFKAQPNPKPVVEDDWESESEESDDGDDDESDVEI
ncbi:uncharacterized protein BDR25DRAFT_319993 [Lindgomyces ingoldianus]|uniref:Uncharacterized protein n=1 Tax=Lindgomyces ingoldianus TaxID=673940 RepID=A0ACB6QAS6_9PLEO|nr:uncharacterized protein BDR25DRAFT_319993 [Lindgomyces ingoldianus]KAF2463482.1 hypothetical protein BDR25DRAFT_319993 [Lindgomyces ingoldianus]